MWKRLIAWVAGSTRTTSPVSAAVAQDVIPAHRQSEHPAARELERSSSRPQASPDGGGGASRAESSSALGSRIAREGRSDRRCLRRIGRPLRQSRATRPGWARTRRTPTCSTETTSLFRTWSRERDASAEEEAVLDSRRRRHRDEGAAGRGPADAASAIASQECVPPGGHRAVVSYPERCLDTSSLRSLRGRASRATPSRRLRRRPRPRSPRCETCGASSRAPAERLWSPGHLHTADRGFHRDWRDSRENPDLPARGIRRLLRGEARADRRRPRAAFARSRGSFWRAPGTSSPARRPTRRKPSRRSPSRRLTPCCSTFSSPTATGSRSRPRSPPQADRRSFSSRRARRRTTAGGSRPAERAASSPSRGCQRLRSPLSSRVMALTGAPHLRAGSERAP